MGQGSLCDDDDDNPMLFSGRADSAFPIPLESTCPCIMITFMTLIPYNTYFTLQLCDPIDHSEALGCSILS